MKPLQVTPELLAVARRVVWFKEPAEALADPIHFLAHVMTYGTIEDLAALRGAVSAEDYREVLARAPPGIFDNRSWSYWHLVLAHHSPAPPLPARRGLAARSQPVAPSPPAHGTATTAG